MSDADAPRDTPAGATTAGKGTPVPVNVRTPRRARTAIALFVAGPAIWSVHFMVVYLAVEAGCTGDGPGLDAFDPPVPTVVTHVATAVGALACLLVAAAAYRRWRSVRRTRVGEPAMEASDRGGFLSLGALLLALMGFVSVLFVGLPALVLPACLP
jgi:uncharacterized membrane protein YidH (DUF202 family)